MLQVRDWICIYWFPAAFLELCESYLIQRFHIHHDFKLRMLIGDKTERSREGNIALIFINHTPPSLHCCRVDVDGHSDDIRFDCSILGKYCSSCRISTNSFRLAQWLFRCEVGMRRQLGNSACLLHMPVTLEARPSWDMIRVRLNLGLKYLLATAEDLYEIHTF